MTKKHFIAIAEMLATLKPIAGDSDYNSGRYSQWVDYVNAMVNLMAAENPRFDRNRFEVACNKN